MEKYSEKFWELANRMRSRIPREQVTEFIVSFLYDYGNENDFFGGASTELLNIADETIKRIPKDIIYDLKEYFDQLSKEEIKTTLMDTLLFDDKFIDKTSKDLGDLSCKLLELMEDDVLFDLGSGRGSFLSIASDYANKSNINVKELAGIEINLNHLSISRMIMEILLEDRTTVYNINYANILSDSPLITYNKGYVYPPLGMRFIGSDPYFKTIFSEIILTAKNSFELVFIDKLLTNLKGENKRGVALVTGRTLFNVADREYREALANSGLLEGIIELPQNILENTSIKLFLLVFSTNNSQVRLLDASNVVTTLDKNNQSNTFSNIIFKMYQSDSVSKKSLKEMKELQNWMPSNALLSIEKPKNGIKLEEVAEVFTGSQYTISKFKDRFVDKDTKYKILTSSDINDGLVDWRNLQNIEVKDTKLDKFSIKYNDLIITSKSSKIKMAVVDFTPTDHIIVTGGMIIVRPDYTRLNPTYLKIYLESEQGQNVLRSIQKGITIITINANSLKGIIVPLINIQNQQKMARKYNDKLSSLLAFKNEIEKIENDLNNFYYEEMGEKSKWCTPADKSQK